MPRAVPMQLAKAYEFAAANGFESEANRIRRETTVHPGFRKGSQVRRAHMLDLFESHNLLDAFFRAHWLFGATEEGRMRRHSYNQDRDAYSDEIGTGSEANRHAVRANRQFEKSERSDAGILFIT